MMRRLNVFRERLLEGLSRVRRLGTGLVGFALLSPEWRTVRAAEPAGKPHLVVFLADDFSFPDSQLQGAADMRTPNMKKLAAAGMSFTHAFVASPSCAPSRAALLTGLMPARNGAEVNHSKPRAELKKLPAFLREQGYEVVAFGKVSHYKHTADYGFDHFEFDGFHEHQAIPAALTWLRERKSEKPAAAGPLRSSQGPNPSAILFSARCQAGKLNASPQSTAPSGFS